MSWEQDLPKYSLIWVNYCSWFHVHSTCCKHCWLSSWLMLNIRWLIGFCEASFMWRKQLVMNIDCMMWRCLWCSESDVPFTLLQAPHPQLNRKLQHFWLWFLWLHTWYCHGQASRHVWGLSQVVRVSHGICAGPSIVSRGHYLNVRGI